MGDIAIGYATDMWAVNGSTSNVYTLTAVDRGRSIPVSEASADARCGPLTLHHSRKRSK
jgi:hypothetical protein